MSEKDVAAGDAALQFDRAELAEAPRGAVTCAVCQASVSEQYFQVNGALACPACKDGLVAARTRGSRAGRVLSAGGLGLLAAIVGAAIWIAIVRVTGYEIGLVAIGVGYLVGAAVRRGSGGRGGWAYQTLAIVLTYSAMVAYYVPYVLEGLRKAGESQETAEPGSTAAPAPGAPSDRTAPAPAGAAAEQETASAGFGGVVVALAFIAGIAFAAPFLAGAENIIGILILLFALYEAWKLNRRQDFTVTGPFLVAAGDAAPAAMA